MIDETFDILGTFGKPGGIYLTYSLLVTRDAYIVHNEAGDDLGRFAYEYETREFCESLIEKESQRLKETT